MHHQQIFIYSREGDFLDWPRNISLYDFASYGQEISNIVAFYETIHIGSTFLKIGTRILRNILLKDIIQDHQSKDIYNFEGKIRFHTESLSCSVHTIKWKRQAWVRPLLASSLTGVIYGIGGIVLAEEEFTKYLSSGIFAAGFLGVICAAREYQRGQVKQLECTIQIKHNYKSRQQQELFKKFEVYKLS